MKIVMIVGDGTSSDIVYNKLSEHFEISKVIMEEEVPRKELIKKRIKKLGLFTVLGQIAFRGVIVPILEKCSAKRIKEICEQFDLNRNRDYRKGNQLIKVCSVNDVSCQQILQELLPDLVIVEGTRIISKETLGCVSAIFINMHTGITPKYRGVHGTYWALYNHDEENAGVTIHFVDEGIDTGNIIYQGPIPVTPKDNFTTYSYLQIGIGLQYEIQAINDFKEGTLCKIQNNLPSKLYSHPTIFQYIGGYLRNGVK